MVASRTPTPRIAIALLGISTACGQGGQASSPVDGGDGRISVDASRDSTGDATAHPPADAAAAADSGTADARPEGVDASMDGGPVSVVDASSALGQCAEPTGARWSDAQAAYAKWKHDLVTSDGARGFMRVKRPDSPGSINTSNSEGTAYGMILAVAMDDQTLFDALWQYEQLFLDGNGLMNWEILPDGSGPTSSGTGAATDADEDMAFALLWAAHHWGGRGALADTYQNIALHQIDLLWQHEVDHGRSEALAPGDQFSDGAAIVNISYFAPAYYRLFGQASGNTTNWNKVVDTSYTILAATLNDANKNKTNGLVPAWSTPAGVPQAPNSSLPTNHQLDSCRTPFRLGQDYCWNAEPRARDYLAKISAFYQGVGVAHIVDGYNLDGTPNPTHTTVNGSAAFIGPAGVGAMSDPAFAMLRDTAYAGVATLNELDGTLYYTESWTALSLVMMNGGFWNPTSP
jgi:endo-1,4-beta-D-glucanase Y